MVGKQRHLTSVAVAAAVAVAGLLAVASPASAHDFIVGSTPTEGEALTAVPAAFSVTANEPIVDFVGDGTGFGIQVTDAAGRFYGDGCLSLVDATMSMPATLGEAGDYTMVWQLISSDSHAVSGTVAFSWAPEAGASLSEGAAAAPVCGEASDGSDASDGSGALPEPTMTTQAEQPGSDASSTAAPVDDTATGTLLWLGGAALAVVVAIGVTLLLVRPKKPDAGAGASSAPAAEAAESAEGNPGEASPGGPDSQQ